MHRTFTVQAKAVDKIISAAATHGVQPDHLYLAVKLDPSVLLDPDNRIPFAQSAKLPTCSASPNRAPFTAPSNAGRASRRKNLEATDNTDTLRIKSVINLCHLWLGDFKQLDCILGSSFTAIPRDHASISIRTKVWVDLCGDLSRIV